MRIVARRFFELLSCEVLDDGIRKRRECLFDGLVNQWYDIILLLLLPLHKILGLRTWTFAM